MREVTFERPARADASRVLQRVEKWLITNGYEVAVRSMVERPPEVFYRQWRGASPPDVSEVRYFRVTKQLGADVPPVRERVR